MTDAAKKLAKQLEIAHRTSRWGYVAPTKAQKLKRMNVMNLAIAKTVLQ